jgi:DNA-binding beta-propeller fold protein YncE
MKTIIRLFLLLLLLCDTCMLPAQTAPLRLPNGWSLSPAGTSVGLGDLPLNLAVSASGKYIAATNNGQSTQCIQLIDPAKLRVTDSFPVHASWLGLVFSQDEKFLFASGGNDNYILRLKVSAGKLQPYDTLRLGKPWPEKISPAGIAYDDDHGLLYVVTKDNNSLYVYDVPNHKVNGQYALGAEGYTCMLSRDHKSLFISCWGSARVRVFDTEKKSFSREYLVGDHPNDLCLGRKSELLYVANANDNSVSVLSLKQGKVIETLNAALFPHAPSGSTTNSLCLSADERTLYIANADNNCLAVFDVSETGSSKSLGFIPCGWYPTCVRCLHGALFVANGKGFSSRANPFGPNPMRVGEKVIYQKGSVRKEIQEQYIGGLFTGTLSKINLPDAKQLAVYTKQVYSNTPYHKESDMLSQGEPGNAVPSRIGESSPVKHVFYIIKENRTYDQVLADMPGGNGDTSLLLFGKSITPNQHAICSEFVLFDNFYVDGEVSADGHNWSDGAYANDYLEKTWPTFYGDRGGAYDSEGHRVSANNKNGFIWDFCSRAKVSFRTYGEFVDNRKATIPVLNGHFCADYAGWDLHVRDTSRCRSWFHDFDSLLAIDKVPQLNTMRFSNDHTEGLSKGRPTPFAHMADNDLAVGMFLEHLSKSSIWKESAVFIVEDDAQNGPDHVDAHRSTLYVAGPYVKRGYVDHSMYSTSSVLRTIELILGLPPMSQYDAAAPSLWKSFMKTANPKPFIAAAENINLLELAAVNNKWSRLCEGFDFRKEDRVPDKDLNEVLWFAVKGELRPCPAPRHAAFFKAGKEKEEDD